MKSTLTTNKAYAAWLKRLKLKVRQVQIGAAVKVYQELMLFYWELGGDILERQKKATWGDAFSPNSAKTCALSSQT